MNRLKRPPPPPAAPVATPEGHPAAAPGPGPGLSSSMNRCCRRTARPDARRGGAPKTLGGVVPANQIADTAFPSKVDAPGVQDLAGQVTSAPAAMAASKVTLGATRARRAAAAGLNRQTTVGLRPRADSTVGPERPASNETPSSAASQRSRPSCHQNSPWCTSRIHAGAIELSRCWPVAGARCAGCRRGRRWG